MFGKFFKKDPRDVALNEFDKIVKLEKKLGNLEVADEIQREMKQTQHGVLLNNFETVAHTFQIKNEISISARDGLVNLQSTDKRVIKMEDNINFENFSEDMKKKYSPKVQKLEGELESELDLSLEKKFLKLRSYKVKKKILNQIKEKVIARVKKASILLAQECPYNEAVFYEFIMNNFKEESFDIKKIEERYEFIYNLITNYDFSDSFDIGIKDVLFVDAINSGMNLTELIQNINTKRYDFILKSNLLAPPPRMVRG